MYIIKRCLKPDNNSHLKAAFRSGGFHGILLLESIILVKKKLQTSEAVSYKRPNFHFMPSHLFPRHKEV